MPSAGGESNSLATEKVLVLDGAVDALYHRFDPVAKVLPAQRRHCCAIDQKCHELPAAMMFLVVNIQVGGAREL